MFIGEREVKSFEAVEGGDWIKVLFTNDERIELSGTLFFKIQTEVPLPGITTSQLVGSYFATELLRSLAINRIQLGMLSHVNAAIENLIENKREKAFAHPFGKKYPLQVTFDQLLAMADQAEQQEEAEKENKKLAEAAAVTENVASEAEAVAAETV